ncbi:AI-2E family transporter [Halofilum ochraceum]|uniref:AI-2E family transporter n=1 Tax=Halofilum ochraceum TaxID=1611323 RepID=UPI000836306B|nr:AI-2E family transporter [Halofilum ochraceum]
MLDVIHAWYRRNFSDPQAVILVILLVAGFSVVLFAGDILAPVLVALILAYLLEGVVMALERWRVPRLAAVSFVVLGFVFLAVVILLGLAPLLSRQVAQLIREVPGMVSQGQQALLRLPEMYPTLFTEQQVRELIGTLHAEVADFGRAVLSVSLSQAVSIFTFIIYVILVPLLVFFMLKDKDRMIAWATEFLPRRRELSFQVWQEVDDKIGNYIRGKVVEIAIVWLVSYVTFALMGLNYSLLLSFVVGISVIVPYVGAISATIPIALIGYFQWGFAAEFWWLLLAYQIIQLLDGNVLVPVLFSEVVNLHPVAIIVAVLFFGGIWGIWGVFFAIPLATLVQAVLNAWPRVQPPQEEAEADNGASSSA